MSTIVAPAWAEYASGSDVDHFADFCEQHLIQSIDSWDGLPLTLEPFQRELFGEAMAHDDGGYPVWRSVVIVMPRKNGKTASLAAYAVYRLLTSDGSPEILLAASSDKQAGRLFEAAATFIRRNPILAAMCRVRDHVGEIVREDGQGKILRLSSDPARLHGYNPSLVVCDELAQWITPMLRRAYAALTSGGGARSSPQIFTITTAGEAKDREDSILGRMLDESLAKGVVSEFPGLKIARFWGAKLLLFNYEAPTKDPHDVDAMKLANPASWITVEYLREQAENPELSDADVLQLHGCVWAAGVSHWLPEDAWRACETDRGWPEPGASVCLGFDGSYNNDSTALVGCTTEDKPHVFVVKVWEKPEGDSKWRVPRDEVSAAVAAALERWDVVELACDPPGWHREIQEWEEQYGGPPVVYYQTNLRTVMSSACSRFFTAVVNRDVTHDGSAVLAQHLSHAHVKELGDLRWIAKDGAASKRKIDAAVAAVVALDRAAQATSINAWIDFA